MPSFELIHRGETYRAQIQAPTAETIVITVFAETHHYRRLDIRAGRMILENSTGQFRCRFVRARDRVWVWVAGQTFEFLVPSADGEDEAAHTASNDARAPMPGTVIKLLVGPGDRVEPGQVMAILEAMKMEHQIRAPRAGVVERVHGAVGQIIDAGAPVVSLADEE
jgi:3-methylcrotonyl-CoA carboxylase alpha subunit